jgi:ribonuclease HII
MLAPLLPALFLNYCNQSNVARRFLVAGVDEVGRGPLAGDVYAAAVILDPEQPIAGLNDSKALSDKKRRLLDVEIRQRALTFCVARAEVHEIDRINILQATFKAMQRAVTGLSFAAEFVLVDGNRTPGFHCPSDSLIKGDSKHDAIKAASIIAKVARDQAMIELHDQYPQYGFKQHKGYPTAAHIAALREHGPSPLHRMSFAPCREAKR